MPNRRQSFAAGLAAAAVTALSLPALADDNQVENGFALETALNVRMFTVNSTGQSPNALPAGGQSELAPSLLVGYKLGRILFGLGLEFNNSTSSTAATSVAGVVTTTTVSASNFLIGPDVQFALVRSADTRVELIGDLALHFGHQFTSTTVMPAPAPIANNVPTDSNFLLSYRLGPGVRFWAHKHFAVQATTGFTGIAYFDLPVNNNPASGNNSQHSIFSAIGLLGAF